MDEGGRAGQKLITRGATTDDDTEEFVPCGLSYFVDEDSCDTTCPTDIRTATADEISDIIDEVNDADLEPDVLEKVLANINAATEICIDAAPPRPDNAVKVKSDFCVCHNGETLSTNNCAATCSTKTAPEPTLFGSVRVEPEIELNELFVNLQGWCNNDIPNSTLGSPQCQLEIFNGSSTRFINMSISGNTFTVPMASVDFDIPIIARIRETQSGSNVSSDAFQFSLKEVDDSDLPQGPLRLTPVSRYACAYLTRVNGSFTQVAKKHFFFASSNKPASLPPDTDLIKCHDKFQFQEDDSILFPRLNLVEQALVLWDQTDIRFNSTNGTEQPDINIEIQDEYRKATNDTSATTNLFFPLTWPNLPTELDDFKDITNANLGFMMLPFLDPNTNRGKCPDRSDYEGDDPLFRILGEKIGTPTEAIYMAESEPTRDSQGNVIFDIMILREGDLKEVWFYFENDQFQEPNEVTAGTKTIHFFFPFDKDNPYIRKSDQKLYTVNFPDQIGKGGVQVGVNQGLRAPDKRFGCVPAID